MDVFILLLFNRGPSTSHSLAIEPASLEKIQAAWSPKRLHFERLLFGASVCRRLLRPEFRRPSQGHPPRLPRNGRGGGERVRQRDGRTVDPMEEMSGVLLGFSTSMSTYVGQLWLFSEDSSHSAVLTGVLEVPRHGGLTRVAHVQRKCPSGTFSRTARGIHPWKSHFPSERCT